MFQKMLQVGSGGGSEPISLLFSPDSNLPNEFTAKTSSSSPSVVNVGFKPDILILISYRYGVANQYRFAGIYKDGVYKETRWNTSNTESTRTDGLSITNTGFTFYGASTNYNIKTYWYAIKYTE